MTESDNTKNHRNDDDFNDNDSGKNDVILLETCEQLQRENILASFEINRKTMSIIARLNHSYEKKTVISNVYQDWIKTIDTFATRAKKKGIADKHIMLLTDTLDDNNEKIVECLLDGNKHDAPDRPRTELDKDATALQMTENKIVALFLDEVKTPYAAIKVDEHIETMPIKSQRFEDWIGAMYYYQQRSAGYSSVLLKEGIAKIQSVLRFGASKSGEIKTLHVRAAAFIDTETKNLDDNVVLYDLCNKDWEIVKITHQGWSIEKNSPQILFKRFPIMNTQVYPLKDYPPDIMEQFMKLTHVYDDENSKLLAEVYLVSLFLLANLPKPMMIPHGIHGSGKSTFQSL